MLSELFVGLLRIPYLKKRIWRGWYQYLARYGGPDWTFMNYGCEDVALIRLKLDEADEKDRSCIQLYNRVTQGVDRPLAVLTTAATFLLLANVSRTHAP